MLSPSVAYFFLLTNTFFVSVIAKREILQAVGMLTTFKNKLSEKRGVAGTGLAPAETARAGSSLKNPKKRSREGGNPARTFRAPGEMPTPPPSRTVARPASPPIDEFNCPILTAVVVLVAAAQELSLTLLGGDRCSPMQ